MTISEQFNKFYHSAILTALFNATKQIRLDYVFEIGELRTKWIDDDGNILVIIEGEDYYDMDDLKQQLKNFNIFYPRDLYGEPLSTTIISTKSLLQHIEFVFALCAVNGIELPIVREEWNRLKLIAEANGY